MASVWLLVFLAGALPYSVWQNVYDGGNLEKAHGVCLDSSNHVVLVGETDQNSDLDCWIMMIEKTGDSLDSWFYDDGDDEKGKKVITTQQGNVAAVISCGFTHFRTVLFGESGEITWQREVAGLGAEARSITLTSDNKIFALGWFVAGDAKMAVHGYDYQGNETYSLEVGGFYTKGTDLVVDSFGNVYTSGDTTAPALLFRFSPQAEYEWSKLHTLDTYGYGLEMNRAGHLFQSGDAIADGHRAFMLLKWLPSDDGAVIMWPDSTHKAYDLGFDEYCRDIKLDAISDCYLAGWQVRGEEEDACVVKTDSAGRMLWSWVYEQEGGQEIEAIEVDSEGYIYLAGSHHNGANWDMLVMQVRQPLTISGRITDTVGASMSGVPIKLSGDTTVEVVSDTDGFYSIDVYNGGNYVVTPDLGGWAFEPSSYSYNPLAHRELDQNFSGEYTAIEEPVTHQSDHFLEVTASSIRYVIPQGQQGIISIFDASGQLIEKVKVTGSGSVEIPALTSGVYFVRLDAGHSVLTEKVSLSLR